MVRVGRSGRFLVTNRSQLAELARGVEPAGTTDAFEREEEERIRASLYMAVVCEAVPRRLGKSADSRALAGDKRVARKIANLYRSLWAAYDAGSAPGWSGRGDRLLLARDADGLARRAGATVRWAVWFPERIELVEERRGLAAAIALAGGMSRWGVRAIRVLDTELINLRRIREDETIGRRGR
jgi:hypothetical protein